MNVLKATDFPATSENIDLDNVKKNILRPTFGHLSSCTVRWHISAFIPQGQPVQNPPHTSRSVLTPKLGTTDAKSVKTLAKLINTEMRHE